MTEPKPALTAGDIDYLKRVNPHTIAIKAMSFDDEELHLVCERITDARREQTELLLRIDDGLELDDLIRAVIDHQAKCHEPRGHTNA